MTLPMKGDIVAFTPPVPSPRNTMPSASPATLFDSVVTKGSEVTKSARHPPKSRLMRCRQNSGGLQPGKGQGLTTSSNTRSCSGQARYLRE